MHKPLVTTIVAAAFLTASAPVRTASAAAYVPAALRAAPATTATTTVAAPAPTSPEGETFESLVEQARAKFKEKDYVGAVALFEKAYSVQPEPAILFNIGRIYEEANNVDAAIAYYEKFIADESVEMTQRDKALQRLQALEKIVEIRKKEEAKKNPQPAQPSNTAQQPTETKTEPRPVGPQPGPQPPVEDRPPQQQNRLLRPIGYSMFGLGAALLIGGGIAGGLAKKQHNAFAFADTLDERREAGQKGKSLAATADGLFIAGGVLAAVGIVLLLIPKGRKSRAAQALRPQVSPGQMGLGYVYRF